MENRLLDFIRKNSPDGGFLQSEYWRKFQEGVGRKTFELEEKDENGDVIILANIVLHNLPIVGDYFYMPRGPIFENPNSKSQNPNKIQIPNLKIKNFLEELLGLAKKNNIGWIRIESNSDRELKLVQENLPGGMKIKKAPVDVQPREIFVLDTTKSEEEILAGMKQKTRYNIKLSQKRGVSVKAISNLKSQISNKYLDEFLRLIRITSERDKIKSHPEDYYRKMFKIIPPDILKLYVAEYEGKIISANLVLFFGKTATYMHGASDNIHREVMAPHLLQWRQILDAKKMGFTKYDLGGIKSTVNDQRSMTNSWSGITKFKSGFAPDVEPIRFPGCYDIVLNPGKYWLYRILRKVKP